VTWQPVTGLSNGLTWQPTTAIASQILTNLLTIDTLQLRGTDSQGNHTKAAVIL
jgi:hypothetical protein